MSWLDTTPHPLLPATFTEGESADDDGMTIGGPPLLIGLRQPAEAERRIEGVDDLRLPVLAAEIVGRLAGPDFLDHLDGVDQDAAALALIGRHARASRLSVGVEPVPMPRMNRPLLM